MSKLLNFAVCTNANFTNGHIRTPLRSVFCHSERSFRYFWLDPKVTKKSRLRALHTPSRRSQGGKSGNSLGSDSLIFFRPARCSVGSPPEARGDERRSVRGEIPHCVRNDKGTSKSIFIQAFSPPPRGLPYFPTLRIGLN